MKTAKRTHSQRVKEGIAKKKALKSLSEDNKLAGALTPLGEAFQGQQTATVDTRALAEFQYRRGLVTALECILREIR